MSHRSLVFAIQLLAVTSTCAAVEFHVSSAGSDADKAGLQQGDVILKCQDREIGSVNELLKIFNSAAKGSKLTLDIWRFQQHKSTEVPVE